ncbi:response regulator [Pararhizobium arenae]|uniref:response regulator n=1 Tax=Pararhizobium arenae TaxID=1856850 RepID=UPI00094B3F20|nr:response regulator [Pararhizobium arenae]
MDHEAYNWISRRAHELWQEEGHPNGRDREHWSQAAQEWSDLSLRQQSPITPSHVTPIRKVLVVDDEPLIRFATLDALEDAGFEVMEAANAYEALVILNSTPVDAVFTDVNMPGATDGLALAKLVRARSPKTRVIVTSGHVQLGVYDLESGVSFVPKPYTHEAIVSLLKR